MPKRILIVEDDAIIRLDLANILREEGYEVVVAANGVAAMQCVREQLPQLIVLDLMMPVMDGWSFRGELLKSPELASIPVIVVSAANDLRKEVTQLGVSACLAKPFSLDMLLDTVQKFCPA